MSMKILIVKKESLSIKMMKNLKVKNLLSKGILKSCIKIDLTQIELETHQWNICMENLLQVNLIFVKPFLGTCTKAMKHYVSPDLEKNLDLFIVHTGTNNFNFVNIPEKIGNEII